MIAISDSRYPDIYLQWWNLYLSQTMFFPVICLCHYSRLEVLVLFNRIMIDIQIKTTQSSATAYSQPNKQEKHCGNENAQEKCSSVRRAMVKIWMTELQLKFFFYLTCYVWHVWYTSKHMYYLMKNVFFFNLWHFTVNLNMRLNSNGLKSNVLPFIQLSVVAKMKHDIFRLFILFITTYKNI